MSAKPVFLLGFGAEDKHTHNEQVSGSSPLVGSPEIGVGTRNSSNSECAGRRVRDYLHHPYITGDGPLGERDSLARTPFVGDLRR